MSTRDFRGTVCVVTGGSRGIGRATCSALAAAGATVIFTFRRSEQESQEVLNDLLSMDPHGQHCAVRSDVSDPRQCGDLVEFVVHRFGRIDVLVNNAGVCLEHDVADASVSVDSLLANLRETMETNFFGAAELMFCVCRQFLKQGTVPSTATRAVGRVVNITSRAAYRGELTAPGYAASKAALSIFGQSLARRLAPQGIAVFTLAPGWVDTEMAREALTGPDASEVLAQHPLGRVARVDEVAEQVKYLALEAPIALTGCTVDINGASYLR